MKNTTICKIVDNVEKIIVGKRRSVELVVCALICGGHVLVEDVPGVGKTSLVSAVSKSLDCSFNRIQFTPDILPSDITGFSMYNQKTGEFEYKRGAIMSNIILADEINRAFPKTQSSLLEVMEENQVTVDGVTYKVPSPFMVLATQNPVEYLGTNPLPEAQLDRFFMRITLGYPSPKEEIAILSRFRKDDPMSALTPVSNAAEILELQTMVRNIYADIKVENYVVGIVNHTRGSDEALLGGSPRASLNLMRAAQAWALYDGRDYVLPDDIQEMAESVLSHRIILKQDARMRKVAQADIIAAAIKNVAAPVI